MEQSLQAPVFSGGAPGRRTYEVTVGTETSDGYVQLNEMLPHALQLARGDRVDFAWRSANEVHTVSFPAEDPRLNAPFGFGLWTGLSVSSPQDTIEKATDQLDSKIQGAKPPPEVKDANTIGDWFKLPSYDAFAAVGREGYRP